MSFVTPLHVRTGYSLLRGTCRPRRLGGIAAALGHSHLAITDVNGLYGVTVFARAMRDVGIRPLFGAELLFGGESIIALICSETGYANLCRIISKLHCDKDFSLTPDVAAACEGLHLIVDSTDLAGDLQSCGAPADALWMGIDPCTQSDSHIRLLLDAAGRLGIRTVATGKAFMAAADEMDIARLMAAIRLRKTWDTVEATDLPHPSAYLRGACDLAARCRDIPMAAENNRLIVESCSNFSLLPRPAVFPAFDCPQGLSPREYLRNQCEKGIQWRYGPGRPSGLPGRMTLELDLIERKGFAEYFLVVQDIVSYARNRGIPVAGRGSGASSLVAYVLGITNVCPLTYDIPFERFLNEGRQDFPDLDLDFCWRIRDEVIDYAFGRWGRDHAAMVCTYNTFQPRSALRETAKVMGLSDDQISNADTFADSHDPRTQQILSLANRIAHLPRNLSVHPGGIVMSPRPMDIYAPMEMSEKGVVITQYDKNAIEDMGLVKLDILGNRSLSTIRCTTDLIASRHGVQIDAETLTHDDPATIRTLQAANTVGCNQLESPAMRHLLRAMQPGDIRDVMKALALIRPGAASLGMKETFIRRQRGLETFEISMPVLQEVLGQSNGVMLYEDDVMLVTEALLGTTRAEADRFRKSVQKCQDDDERLRLSEEFIGRCKQRGVPVSLAKDMWVQMAKFNAYSFCRAHAGSYARLAWAVAYLKTHYPLEFWTGAMNNNQSMYHPRLYVEQARREGVRFRLPDVNRSDEEFMIDDDAIRVGFNRIAGLGPAGCEAICDTRQRRRFAGLTDLVRRTHMGKKEARSLVLCGACDCFGVLRPALMMELALCERSRVDVGPEQASLIAAEPTLPEVRDYSPARKYIDERSLLGISVRGHLMGVFRGELDSAVTCDSRDLRHLVGKRVRIAGLLEAMRTAGTQGGKDVMFMSLDDEYGLFEVTVFADSRKRSPRTFEHYGPYVVSGRVQEQFDTITVTADRITLWNPRDSELLAIEA